MVASLSRIIGLSVLLLALFPGCATARPAVSSTVTFINHRQDVDILFVEGRTDQGATLVNPGTLRYSPERFIGPGAGGLSSGRGLAEWVELRWQELDPKRLAKTDAWLKLDQAARAAYFAEQRALPIRSVRVPVRSQIPHHVIEEVMNSPARVDIPSLPLKSFWFFLTWTSDGVKLGWRVKQGCCTVLYEGGDPVR